MFDFGSFRSTAIGSKSFRSKSFRSTLSHGKLVCGLTIAAAIGTAVFASAACANPFFLLPPVGQAIPQYEPPVAALPQEPDDGIAEPSRFKRQIVDYRTSESAGTVIVDTPHTYLYYVLGNGKAIRYGIGVGREGFTWSGTQTVSRKAEWPDWTPPAEMLQRQPYLPRFMAGGPQNPLGARAMYLGGTVYRIHGTNAPTTIGGRVSSGCIRMVNEDVVDLYGRVNVGTKVIVLPVEHHADSVRGARG
jgi:lipoprotein-anchoring transpeptidase ErfK/SrfK